MSSDNVINEIARDLINFVSEEGDIVSLSYIAKRIESLELLLNFKANSSETECGKCIKEEMVKYQAACHETDISSILDSVKKAEKARLDKLEYEAMAQLLNRAGCKSDLIAMVDSMKRIADEKAVEANVIDRKTAVRRSALVVLTHLIASLQESLLHDPDEALLPPIETIDRSLFI